MTITPPDDAGGDEGGFNESRANTQTDQRSKHRAKPDHSRSSTPFFRWDPIGNDRGNGSLEDISHALRQAPTDQDTNYGDLESKEDGAKQGGDGCADDPGCPLSPAGTRPV